MGQLEGLPWQGGRLSWGTPLEQGSLLPTVPGTEGGHSQTKRAKGLTDGLLTLTLLSCSLHFLCPSKGRHMGIK